MVHPETRVTSEGFGGEPPAVKTVGGYLLRYGVERDGLLTASNMGYSEVFEPRAFMESLGMKEDLICEVCDAGGGCLPEGLGILRRSRGDFVLREEMDGVSYALAVRGEEHGRRLAEAMSGGAEVTVTFGVLKDWWETEGDGGKRVRHIAKARITGLRIQGKG